MSPSMPDGEPVPPDGRLPGLKGDPRDGVGFGIYLHVPFCRVRCGYCDFNTYTASELDEGGASTTGYVSAALAEMDLAHGVLEGPRRTVDTIFVGGGTPTLLSPHQLATLLGGVAQRWDIAAGAEVTTEANPDTITPEIAGELASAGFTRVSIGMQSAVPQVLATLDRTHVPAHVPAAVAAVKAAGMQVSIDLIYGTPGESLHDWQCSVQAALALEPDHISAYALTVEPGTALSAAVRRGAVAMPSDDDEADKYELLDELLTAAGYQWYEISNWSREARARCRHNIAYWTGADWWGIGPGAHSHVAGTRWWNVKHPRAYRARLEAGLSPGLAREVLTPAQQHTEAVMLGLRMVEGLDLSAVSDPPPRAVDALVDRGLLDRGEAAHGRAVLTRAGRLLADSVVRALLDSEPATRSGV